MSNLKSQEKETFFFLIFTTKTWNYLVLFVLIVFCDLVITISSGAFLAMVYRVFFQVLNFQGSFLCVYHHIERVNMISNRLSHHITFLRFSQEYINPGNAPFIYFPNGEIKNFGP